MAGNHGGRRRGAGRKFISKRRILCFRCGREAVVEKNRHSKYTYCARCRREISQFWPGRAWIDHDIGRL